MIDLSSRSLKKELLDEDDIPFPAIRQNLVELDAINKFLGGHRVSIKGFKKLYRPGEPITICEIGCGGGDNIANIKRWCDKHRIAASFTGIDIKQECIDYCKIKHKHLGVTWICSDYKKVIFPEKPGVLYASLFCHHFSEEELVDMMQWLHEHSRVGFFINDLHRHPMAYYPIKIITSIFSKSYLVKNDAPLSVARGFRKQEWEQILSKAGLSGCSVNWMWAFRHLVTCSKKSQQAGSDQTI